MDFALVDAVLEETGRREKLLRLLPSRVVVYFVLTLALFEHCSYRTVWSKLTAALTPLEAQNYTVHTTVAFFAHGLNSRSQRCRNGVEVNGGG